MKIIILYSQLKTKKKRLGKKRLGRPKKKFEDTCGVCEETFKLKKDLLNHKKEFEHYGEQKLKTYCEKCDKSFIKKHSYKRHLGILLDLIAPYHRFLIFQTQIKFGEFTFNIHIFYERNINEVINNF